MMKTVLNRVLSLSAAFVAAGSLALSGCSPSEKEAARQTGEAVGDAAKEAATATATATGDAAVATAVNPVLDLLRRSQADVKAGNMAAAIEAMGGFSALWVTAAPVIQPLAGDKWPMIDSAAKLVLKTFDKGATPDADAAGSAISGLIGPLKALKGN